MYRLSAFLMAMAISGSLLAQSPQKFNYQGIARDAKGNPVSDRTLGLKLSVLPAADAIVPEYEEIQTVTTNEFGLYTLQIGSGVSRSGDMKNVTWETGSKYIRVAIDPEGGSNYQDAGTTQLLSVPYALYADRAGTVKSGNERTGAVSSNAAHVVGDANYLSKFTALNVIGKSQIFDNGSSVGIGTNAPAASSSLHIRRTTAGQYLYLENPTANSSGAFRLYNDNPANFATFTKYGSGVSGGYTGIADKYPFANILGYGNNGPFLNAGTGNIGFAITKAGTNKLKIHIDAAAERIGFGGNASPQVPVHFNNTAAANDTVKFTNQTTGHLAGDGTELRFNGNTTRLINRENGALILGTNNTDRIAIGGSGNVGIGTTSPGALLDVNGQVKIQGGNPGVGKVLSSDASGLATWQMPGADSQWARSGIHVVNRNPGGVGIGASTPAGKFQVSVAQALYSTYSGGGPNNFSYDVNGYTGTDSTNFCVRVSNAQSSPNQIEISTNGGQSWSAAVPISANIPLGLGAVGNFASPTGHNLNDQWCFTAKAGGSNGLLVTNDRVGVGTLTPANRLDIEGGIAVGTSYSGASAAPTNGAIIQGNVGIGTSNPGAALDVNGQVKIQGGNPGAGKLLTSDADGLASWKEPVRSYANTWSGTVGPNGWDSIYVSGSNWGGGKGILVTGNCTFTVPSYHLNNPQFAGFQHDIVMELRVFYAPYGMINMGRVRYQTAFLPIIIAFQ